MPDYPECEKMRAVREKSQAIGEFIAWLEHKGIYLMTRKYEDDWYSPSASVEELLAAFFKIDLNKVEKERQAMLEEIRSASPTGKES